MLRLRLTEDTKMKLLLLTLFLLASCSTTDNRPNHVKFEERKRQARQNF